MGPWKNPDPEPTVDQLLDLLDMVDTLRITDVEWLLSPAPLGYEDDNLTFWLKTKQRTADLFSTLEELSR